MVTHRNILVILRPESAHARRFLQGIAKYVHSHKEWSIFYETNNYERICKFIKNMKINGIIAHSTEIHRIYKNISKKISLVSIGKDVLDIPKLPAVISDSKAIAEIAFEHFRQRGFENFAFCGHRDLLWSEDRKKEYETIIKKNNFDLRLFETPYLVDQKPLKKEFESSIKWLLKTPKPISILGCSDRMGRYLIEACRFAGIHIPEEIAILGIDDDEVLCNLTTPPLSSIFMNSEQSGYAASELLKDLMNGKKMEGQTIITKPTEIKVRRSSDIFSVNDPELANILHYIYNNTTRYLDVNIITDIFPMSRRNLYSKCVKATGKSIGRHITDARISSISTMLLNTNLAIYQIADKFGFSEIGKLSRLFKKHKGVSPSDFRRRHMASVK